MNDMDSIGGVLREYLDKEKVRTYIKDVLIHNYAVSKRSAIVNSADVFAKQYLETENYRKTGTKKEPVYITSNKVLIICHGTMIKWETALRHALESRYKMMSSTNQKNLEYHIVLRLSYTRGKFPESDFISLRNTLSLIGVSVDFISE